MHPEKAAPRKRFCVELAAFSLHLSGNGLSNDGFYRAGPQMPPCVIEHQALCKSCGDVGAMAWVKLQGDGCRCCLNQRLRWPSLDGLYYFSSTHPSATLGGAAHIFVGGRPSSAAAVITPALWYCSKRRKPDSQSWCFCPIPPPPFPKAKKTPVWCCLPCCSSPIVAWPWLRIAVGQGGGWIAFVEGMRLGQMWSVESGFEKIEGAHAAVGMCVR